MASIKKKPKLHLPEVIQRVSKDTIDYSESLNNPSWDNERKWADEIMKSIRSYGLKFHLDKLTRGKGSCFFVVYWRDTSNDWQLTVERFSPYWTDHDALLTTVKRR